MQKGNGVDVVKKFNDFYTECNEEKHDGLNYRYEHEIEYDSVLCLDMLENAKEPFRINEAAKQCLKGNAVLSVTPHFNYNIHE